MAKHFSTAALIALCLAMLVGCWDVGFESVGMQSKPDGYTVFALERSSGRVCLYHFKEDRISLPSVNCGEPAGWPEKWLVAIEQARRQADDSRDLQLSLMNAVAKEWVVQRANGYQGKESLPVLLSLPPDISMTQYLEMRPIDQRRVLDGILLFPNEGKTEEEIAASDRVLDLMHLRTALKNLDPAEFDRIVAEHRSKER